MPERLKDALPAFEDWHKTNGSGMGPIAKRNDFERFGGLVNDYIRDAAGTGEHGPAVIRAGKALQRIYLDAAQQINNPLKATGGIKRGLTEVEVKDEAGNVVLVGKLADNPNYLPRKADGIKWNEMTVKLGRDGVEAWWAGAYKAARNEASRWRRLSSPSST